MVPTNECSPDRSSGITETNKAGQDHMFLNTKATGDTAICQQQLKKTRIQQPTGEGQTVKVEHETVMASDEGNMLVDSLNQHHIHRNIISEGILTMCLFFSLLLRALYLATFLQTLLSTYRTFFKLTSPT